MCNVWDPCLLHLFHRSAACIVTVNDANGQTNERTSQIWLCVNKFEAESEKWASKSVQYTTTTKIHRGLHLHMEFSYICFEEISGHSNEILIISLEIKRLHFRNALNWIVQCFQFYCKWFNTYTYKNKIITLTIISLRTYCELASTP